MATLSLGKVDAGAMPASKSEFLKPYHTVISSMSQAQSQFRDEADSVWRDFQVTEGSDVRKLQQFLHRAGFLPKADVKPDMIDGVFGYATQAAVRLFQEYIRTVEKIEGIGAPDGAVGPNTQSHIKRWEDNGIHCEWSNWGTSNRAEYDQWIALLSKAKSHFQTNDREIVDLINRHPNPGDTRKIDHWEVSADMVHLIGLRQGEAADAQRDMKGRFVRANDDLFIFLINGMVFKFWGSTDPNPELSENPSGNPFLVEGQHHYQFGWHNIGPKKQHQVYRALKPATSGVLVYRVPDARGLTPEEVNGGLDSKLGTDINIHWSGKGGFNFSAGCQVIAGSSYINHRGEVVNCSKHAALNYAELGSKGRGAYNVFTDLLLTYGPAGERTIAYTLGRDETLRLADVPEWKDANFVRGTVKRMMEAR